MNSKTPSLVLIVGMARSGTTLLQCLLSASPDAYSLPETHFFSAILPYLSKSALEPLTDGDLSFALSILRDKMALEVSESDYEALRMQASRDELAGKDLFEFVLECYRPPQDRDKRLRAIEKTPRHVDYLPQIHAWYPGARFVHVVRDPRNVISSLINTPFAQSQWIPWHTERWNRTLDIVSEFDASVPSTIMTIRYEDLVENTAGTLRAVCEFLELRYLPEMLTAFSDQLTHSALIEKEPWKQGVGSGRIRSERDAWKKRISPGLAWYIERETQLGMEAYGYSPAASPSWLERVRTHWQVWALLRRDPKALDMCANLAFRYAESGELPRARTLAVQTVFGDWRWILNGTIRKVLASRLRLMGSFHREEEHFD